MAKRTDEPPAKKQRASFQDLIAARDGAQRILDLQAKTSKAIELQSYMRSLTKIREDRVLHMQEIPVSDDILLAMTRKVMRTRAQQNELFHQSVLRMEKIIGEAETILGPTSSIEGNTIEDITLIDAAMNSLKRSRSFSVFTVLSAQSISELDFDALREATLELIEKLAEPDVKASLAKENRVDASISFALDSFKLELRSTKELTVDQSPTRLLCVCCGEEYSFQCLAKCDHATCADCFELRILDAISGADKRKVTELRCLNPSCGGTYPDAMLSLLGRTAFQTFIKAKVDVEIARKEVQLSSTKVERSFLEIAIENYSPHIAEKMTSKCPRCSQAMDNFTGCLALVCSLCDFQYCALCFNYSESDVHQHVKTCKHRKLYPQLKEGEIFLAFDLWQIGRAHSMNARLERDLRQIESPRVAHALWTKFRLPIDRKDFIIPHYFKEQNPDFQLRMIEVPEELERPEETEEAEVIEEAEVTTDAESLTEEAISDFDSSEDEFADAQRRW